MIPGMRISSPSHIASISSSIPVEIFIDKNRIFDFLPENNFHIFLYIIIIESGDHVLTAQYVRKDASEQGIRYRLPEPAELLPSVMTVSLRSTLYMESLQKFIETFSVFRHIDAVRLVAEDFYTVFMKVLRQFYGSLSAESYHYRRPASSVAMIFITSSSVQRLEIKAVCVSKSVDTVSGLLFTITTS